MIKSFFKIVLRNLWLNKLYTGINITGLSIGIAAIVWGIQTWRYSFSFDEFHTNGNQVFRVLTKMQGSDVLKGICPLPLSSFGKQDFSVIEQAVSWNSRGLDIKAAQNEPFAVNAHFTDPAFFELFNFPLLKGTVNLADRSTAVLTESAAKKYFGNADPVGQTLLLYSGEPYRMSLTVTGVLKDPPPNSTINFELITNTGNFIKADGIKIAETDWGRFADAVFLKLANPAEAATLEKQLAKYIPLQQQARKDLKVTGFKMESVAEIALQSNRLDNNSLMERPEDSAAYGPIVLALLVLLSACLNFANTSIAQSNRRLKEMGIRKVMGGTRKQIILQQLSECGLVVLLAVFLSVLINLWWLPEFSSMFRFVTVTADYLHDYTLLALLAVVLIGVTLLAGAYPAFYISRFNASNIFRGAVKFGGRNLFSRVLLGLQIAISFITVIASLAFYRNADFQKNYDYGFNKNAIIGFHIPSANDYHALRNELAKLDGIESMAGTRQHIGFWHRTASLESEGKKKESQYLETGEQYLTTMQLKLVTGRDFNTEGNGDIGKSVLINQHLAFQFGWNENEALGKQIKIDTVVCTVTGVLKDFISGGLYQSVEPFAIRVTDPSQYAQLIVRARPEALTNVYNQAKTTWAKLFPLKPFSGYYQSEASADSLTTNNSITSIFLGFAFIAMLLSATGFFALISLTLLKKMREIAIRKVVGAGTKHIYTLIVKGYVPVFLLAAAVGCYAGYVLAKLLMDMIFIINAGVDIISLWISFAVVFIITAAVIGARIRSALNTKVSEVLKKD